MQKLLKSIQGHKAVILLLISLIVSSQTEGSDRSIALTHDAKNLSEWIVSSGDHQQLPFIIVDKRAAKVFLFMADGNLHASSAALLGIAVGDDTAPSVGQKKLSDMSLDERTTPAGRFVADIGLDLKNSEILWVDYDSGLSLHTVVTSVASERRTQRLASERPADLRITYGCINVSGQFYQEFVYPTFKNTNGIVYILPEVHSIGKVFGPDAALFSLR
jgi:hypothetical protein